MGVFPKFIFRVRIKENLVALTFDDGPHPEFTKELLDLFKERGIKATFFVTGEKIEKHREIIKRMIADGHELGNHSYSHKNLIFKKKSKIKEEIQKTDYLLRDLGVKGEIHFRPPYGRLLFSAFAVLASLNKKVIMWNIPTKDYKERDPKVILSRIYKRIKPGSIIVLHDSGIERTGKEIDRQATIDAVKELINELPKKVYKFRTVSELIDY
ncbi:MAG: polysaccharide deacetylase family protein [Candidatus Cloacimonetes bacterium]|jgi:peptidoglycan/xylan/chitin deacetylase (PgdA/CDA1 family)|nr:polysaccharide deacetylase family protein [Candidatus Cloacimonadota bacterium]